MKKRYVNSIVAGIVTYNPDLVELKKNIESIIYQVNGVICFDNGSNNIESIKNALSKYNDNIKIITSSENVGIATALNEIIRYAIEKNKARWVLTLDQDTISPTNIIEEYKKYISQDIGILCPLVEDRNYGDLQRYNSQVKEVNECITSGSLINIDAWKKVNGFDEKLFIDGVDFDICYRIRENGYKILQIGSVKISHEIGHIEKRHFLFFTVIVKNHNAFRKYYIARNTIYLAKKRKSIALELKSYLQNIKLLLIVIFYEKEKKDKIRSITKGTIDGMKMKV